MTLFTMCIGKTCVNAGQTNAVAPASTTKPTVFTVDSGASVHCINDASLFEQIYTDHRAVRVVVASGQVMVAKCVGTVRIKLRSMSSGEYRDVLLHNVIYHPDFSSNLLSVRRLWRDSRISTKFSGSCYFREAATRKKFEFECTEKGYRHTSVYSVSQPISPEVIHSRFGHCSSRRIRQAFHRSTGFPCDHKDLPTHEHDPTNCDACNQGGMKRKPVNKRPPKTFTYYGQQLSSDLLELPKSLQGHKYLLNIIDGYSNWLVVVPLKTKSAEEVGAAMRKFMNEYKHWLPTNKPVTWHTDNGGEFTATDIDEFCQEFCVHRSFSIPYVSPQNRQAERAWSTILRTMRVMLSHSGVHESLWTYAADHACWLHNRLPSSTLPGEVSPYERVTGKLPNLARVRTWGCLVWYYLPAVDRTHKLAPRAVPAVHLGLDPHRRGYRVYVPYLNRITSAHHISFQETRFLVFSESGIASMPRVIKPLHDTEHQYREDRDQPPRHPRPSGSPDHGDSDDSDAPSTRAEQERKGKNPRRSTRQQNPIRDLPDRDLYRGLPNLYLRIDDVSHDILAVHQDAAMGDIVTPAHYEQATKSRFSHRWWQAMKEEIEGLLSHNTWKLVERSEIPASRKITKSRWCYAIKHNRDGSIERFKARFVVCGYSQVKGHDYTDSFSATMRATSFRMLMALAAGEKLKLEQFDVKNAFTQSDIDSDIYVQPPQGFETKGKDGKPMVLKLVKSLYGTKQASRLWQLRLRDHLVNHMGFTNSTSDPCLFSKRGSDGSVMILGVYVDDIVLAHKNADLDWFIREFTGPKGFNAKHLGKLSWFLGMGIDQHEDSSVSIEQTLYVKKLVEKFCPTARSMNKRAHPTPNAIHFQKLRPAENDVERERASRLPYLQLIGSLLYLSTMTRPDIAYYMSTLCTLMHDPTVAAYNAAIDLLLYVHHTNHTHLHFSGSTTAHPGIPQSHHAHIALNHGLMAYSDASWHKPDSLGFNMFGHVVYLFGGPISFASKHLKVVALSSAEAEYAAASYTCKEIMFVRQVCAELGVVLTGPTVLAVDNEAAIKIARNIGVTGRNKHFQDSLHFFRHLYDHQIVDPVYVTTKNQRADGFTKALPPSLFGPWFNGLVSRRV